MVKLEKNRRGLGISIAGHKDRNKMAVFICGLNPKGAAYQKGELKVGDEILEVYKMNFDLNMKYNFLIKKCNRQILGTLKISTRPNLETYFIIKPNLSKNLMIRF